MSSLIASVKSYIIKAPPVKDESTPDEVDNPEHVKEHEAMDFVSDKKSDEQSENKPQAGILWRVTTGVGSGLYNATTGAVGYGVGGVKWVATKSYDAGSTVVATVKNPPLPEMLKKKKDKKE